MEIFIGKSFIRGVLESSQEVDGMVNRKPFIFYIKNQFLRGKYHFKIFQLINLRPFINTIQEL